MAVVTVLGAHGAVMLTYSASENAVLAARLAAAISAGVANSSIAPADSQDGPPPALTAGATGEFIASTNGVTFLPTGYNDIVMPDTASQAVIFGSAGPNEQVLAGSGNLTFNATGGNGAVVTGDGNNQINIAASDTGAWLIKTGGGGDTIRALGSGNDSIDAGAGHNYIQLGGGRSQITSEGQDTILASVGSETIAALGAGGTHATDLIYGNASMLFLIADGGATVIGGSGSDTVIGGTGPDLLYGGSAGNNYLQAGNGPATLFAGGNNDQLYAGGSAPQELHAAAKNETLFGGFASGQDTFYAGSGADQITGGTGQNTFVLGTGTATITALSSGSFDAVFEAINGQAGGADTVQGLTAANQLTITLSGYGPDEAANAIAGQTSDGSSVTIALSDGTKLTFDNITHLTASNFS